MHRLALNENPLPPLPTVTNAIARASREANRYPEFFPRRLEQAIAAWQRVPGSCVVAGPGSVGVAQHAVQALVRPGGTLAYGWRNFDAYPLLAEMTGVRALPVPLLPGGHQDLDRLAEAAADADAVILCNPHNPTGRLVPAHELKNFVSAVPTRTTVLLDEAYIEFVQPPERPETTQWIHEFPHLIVLRTFSKAYGLAGLRVGYGIACEDLARRLRTRQLPYAIGPVAAAAVEAALGCASELEERVRLVAGERERTARGLAEQGWQVLPSHANFLWLDEPERTGELARLLERAGIQGRVLPGEGVRLTIGDRADNDAVLAALSAGGRAA
ncbi:aminotransferase class I/II-fold pyridoxal phosphate-dependent enzyme [Streptomyces sp. PRKS01-65]|nr:aminotransferase class I/II-fold pyridoxal phosphate-dependent enzyme [Streptomyces harenosi]NEY35857.1 aminotransferase class I/II-fold pyridoxal phosphate-dependent enzyme [Streptomyces harenosi]